MTKISLNLYKKQITTLLNHNKTKKTTTISILTNIFTYITKKKSILKI